MSFQMHQRCKTLLLYGDEGSGAAADDDEGEDANERWLR